ncbi:hypothetical protein WS81_00045 [Burkholderia sp. MSMB2040]|nr:hypothetical protein WS81_00045 [Burkholderia sp. MSMB2040]
MLRLGLLLILGRYPLQPNRKYLCALRHLVEIFKNLIGTKLFVRPTFGGIAAPEHIERSYLETEYNTHLKKKLRKSPFLCFSPRSILWPPGVIQVIQIRLPCRLDFFTFIVINLDEIESIYMIRRDCDSPSGHECAKYVEATVVLLRA